MEEKKTEQHLEDSKQELQDVSQHIEQEETNQEETTDEMAENQPDEQATAETDEEEGLSEVDQLKADVQEQKDKYLRLYSEFENFRRRNAKERIGLIKSANAQLLEQLLPVLDDFERSISAFSKDEQKDIQPIVEGVTLIYDKFKKTLVKEGLEEMKINAGDDFDSDHQEAITQIPVEDEKLKGKIVDVVEKGYLLNDKVVRFAKVVTGA